MQHLCYLFVLTCSRALAVCRTIDRATPPFLCFAASHHSIDHHDPSSETAASWRRIPYICKMKEVLHASFDSWSWYTSHEARTPWMLQLYTFTVLASVVPELNILMWHEFYYLAFSFGLTVLSCHYPSQVCRRPRVSSQTRFFCVSDCLGRCACASSSFGEKAKAPWPQVQLCRSARYARGEHLVCSLSVFAVELVVMFCCFKCFKFKPT